MCYMSRPTSFRLPEDLLERLDTEAASSGTSATALVAMLLDEGLKIRSFTGIVYRAGPTGRRAALAGGPDVWEIVRAVRATPGNGDQRLRRAADDAGLRLEEVRLAVDFYTAYPTEVDARIDADEDVARQAREMIDRRERLLSG
jgi:hypothetical protein